MKFGSYAVNIMHKKALDMGLINTVVPYADLEKETVRWCREMLQNSPIALRCLKAALNADCDGQAGLQELAGNATMLFYMTEEGQEGRNAFNEKREPDFSKFRPQSIIDGKYKRFDFAKNLQKSTAYLF